jgi:chemotaxis protein methyltransferase CheR
VASSGARDPRWTPLSSVRRLVEFEYLNLRDPIYPSIFTRTTELDLVVCRNVFLYFFPEMIRNCVERFSQCVVDDGFLLFGPSDLLQIGVPPGFSEEGFSHRLRAGHAVPAPAPRVSLAPRAPQPRSPASRAERPPAPPKPPNEHPDLVRLLYTGDYAAAAAAAGAELRRAPLSLEVARCHALALSALGDRGAKEAWGKVLYLDATDAGAHFAIGMVLLQEQRRPEARAHFRAVRRLLRNADDAAKLPGPDPLPIGWVRSVSRSLAGDSGLEGGA